MNRSRTLCILPLLLILFSLHLSAQSEVPEAEPNDVRGEAQILREGDVINGGIHQNGEGVAGCPEGLDSIDMFMIPRTYGGEIRLRLEVNGGDLGAFVSAYEELYIGAVYTSPFEFIADTTLTIGCFGSDTIWVALRTGEGQLDGCLDYRLSWERVPIPGTSDPEPNAFRRNRSVRLEPGVEVAGRLGYDFTDEQGSFDIDDTYYLTGLPPGDIIVSLERNREASVRLLLSNTQSVVAVNEYPDTSLRLVFPCIEEADTVFLSLTSYYGCHTYRLRVDVEPRNTAGLRPDPEPNDVLPTAIEIPEERPLEGTIGRLYASRTRDERDFWAFHLNPDDTIDVELMVYGDAEVNLALYNNFSEEIGVYRGTYPREGNDTIRFRAWHFNYGLHKLALISPEGCAEYYGRISITGPETSVGDDSAEGGEVRLISRGGAIEIDRGASSRPLRGLQIFDASGRTVYHDPGLIDCDLLDPDLPTGTYLYRLQSGERTFEGRLHISEE